MAYCVKTSEEDEPKAKTQMYKIQFDCVNYTLLLAKSKHLMFVWLEKSLCFQPLMMLDPMSSHSKSGIQDKLRSSKGTGFSLIEPFRSRYTCNQTLI